MVYSSYTSIDSLFSWFLRSSPLQVLWMWRGRTKRLWAAKFHEWGICRWRRDWWRQWKCKKSKIFAFWSILRSWRAHDFSRTGNHLHDSIVMRRALIAEVSLASTNSPRWGNILQMNQTNVLLFQVKDLPNELTSVDSLMAFLTRLLWQLSAQHAALNYPVADYGGFTLNMPTKLYQDSRVSDDVFSLFNFPNANISAVSILSSLYRHIVLISPRDYKRLINSLYYGLQCNFCACLMSQLYFRV